MFDELYKEALFLEAEARQVSAWAVENEASYDLFVEKCHRAYTNEEITREEIEMLIEVALRYVTFGENKVFWTGTGVRCYPTDETVVWDGEKLTVYEAEDVTTWLL